MLCDRAGRYHRKGPSGQHHSTAIRARQHERECMFLRPRLLPHVLWRESEVWESLKDARDPVGSFHHGKILW